MPFAVYELISRESECYTATMQISPAVGPNRLVEGVGVLVTALQTNNVNAVYRLQKDSSHRQQIKNFHCGLPAGPVLL